MTKPKFKIGDSVVYQGVNLTMGIIDGANYIDGEWCYSITNSGFRTTRQEKDLKAIDELK